MRRKMSGMLKMRRGRLGTFYLFLLSLKAGKEVALLEGGEQGRITMPAKGITASTSNNIHNRLLGYKRKDKKDTTF